MLKKKQDFYSLLNTLPISINAQLGDPFQSTQWEDTKSKLLALEKENYLGPVAFITKSILTPEQIAMIKNSPLDLFIFLSLTGLNENKHTTFEEISKNYLEICKTNKNVAIFIRPIIPGYNDKLTSIEPILKLATLGTNEIIIRGYKDIFRLNEASFMDPQFLAEVKNLCQAYGINVFDKTAFYVASKRQNHFYNPIFNDQEVSIGVELLKALGYPIWINEKTKNIEINSSYDWSQGDLNFIRMLTGKIISIPLKTNDAIMTIRPNNCMLDCSSSWFGWVRRIPCQINCWYCLSKIEEVNFHKDQCLGCLPTSLLDHLNI